MTFPEWLYKVYCMTVDEFYMRTDEEQAAYEKDYQDYLMLQV